MTMQDKPNDLLLLAGKVLTVVMQAATAIASAFLVLAIPALLFFQEQIGEKARAEYSDALGPFPIMSLIGLFLIIIAILAMAFVFFGKLRAIISTVGDGEPFVPENAERLNLMAWLLLAVQVLAIPATALAFIFMDWADEIEGAQLSIDEGVDLTSILMVIVLFILARVFKHGAAMREDLEGTV